MGGRVVLPHGDQELSTHPPFTPASLRLCRDTRKQASPLTSPHFAPQESFIEARVVVFVINEDWLDSIPCNQEFEALITRKRRFRWAAPGLRRTRANLQQHCARPMARAHVCTRPSIALPCLDACSALGPRPAGEHCTEACICSMHVHRPESRDAIIFVDITDDKFNKRWGAKLPQVCADARHRFTACMRVHGFCAQHYEWSHHRHHQLPVSLMCYVQFKEGLAYEASKHFDVHQFTYNAQTSSEDKLKVKQEFATVVSKYAAKHPPLPGVGELGLQPYLPRCVLLHFLGAQYGHSSCCTVVLQCIRT